MPQPILHKYFDFGDRALANLTLTSGERVLLTIVPNGFAVHRLYLFGIFPGQCLFGAGEETYLRMADVLARDKAQLPPLPRATGRHQIDPAARSDAGAARANLATRDRPLELFTRLALTARDENDLVRLFERTRSTAG
jgi:hypothetical protein